LEGLWNALWHTLLNILVAINSVVGIPGVSIVIFTLLMRLLTVPLTMKSLRSSRNMQAIQPKVKEIQKQYAKDRAKQQEETMKLYQQYGINPAAGCFPILVQLPIFFGLFSALQFTLQYGTDANALRAVLWNDAWVSAANFSVPFFWVPSLAAADPFFIWPVLSGVFQFIQSRMSIPYREPGTPVDPQQQMMNTMLQVMPIIIVFTSATFPAGTVIYWAFSSLFGAVQQYFITGFGILPTFPGLGFLPRKTLTVPSVDTLKPAAPRKRGMVGWMMDKALEAQEAQKAAQGQTEQGAVAAAESDGASTVRVSSAKKGSSRPRKNVGKPQHYQVEGVGSDNASGDGLYSSEEPSIATVYPTTLPRKKRSKR
jgi:YidC/Oxa1 family membrane protein insertase